ncbi:MAG: stimulus-sensing domain-containing protein, partial [Acidobacteria bacterium]|nr:stimulus-sensing domain-containing protein [Acidobacteriota bacterium]
MPDAPAEEALRPAPEAESWRGRLLRLLSRIWIRLLAFNVLLVFLPAAGLVYLASYEEELLTSQEDAMAQEGRLLAAALAGPVDDIGEGAPELDEELARLLLARLNRRSASRLRILDRQGNVVADSVRLGPRREPGEEGPEELLEPIGRRSWVYRTGSTLFRLFEGLLRNPGPPSRIAVDPAPEDLLETREVQRALAGEYGAAARPSKFQRSLTLYSALPIERRGEVVGVALVSRSTYRILQSLYGMRLRLFRIFLASVGAAVVLSLLVATTIVRPVRHLRHQSQALLDRRGRLLGRFKGSNRRDEIGDLSRALEELTRRLQEHIRFIESFAADVSHEFKNPLASIRTAAETAAEISEPEEQAHFLTMIQRQVARMEHLLTGARDLTRLDAQLEQEERSAVDLEPLLEEVVEGFRLRGNGSGVTFELAGATGATEDGSFQVMASPDRLAQVLENLLENALSFSPPGGRVEIRRVREDGKARITVADSGPGIPEDDLDKIFERFFSYRPQAQKGDHIGLGLAV